MAIAKDNSDVKSEENKKSRYYVASGNQLSGWFQIAMLSEAKSESETQGDLRSSVNRKRIRNRNKQEHKVSFLLRLRFGFRRFRR